ncbi:hypothetical protein Bbelb_160550 [Branchiostoma belcheri]|nr:hypothetical protein Bbelb_160550 [Branchiostoma belcheri]
MGVLTVIILPVLLTVFAAEAGQGAAKAGKLGAAEAGQGAAEAKKFQEQAEEPSLSHIPDTIKAMLSEGKPNSKGFRPALTLRSLIGGVQGRSWRVPGWYAPSCNAGILDSEAPQGVLKRDKRRLSSTVEKRDQNALKHRVQHDMRRLSTTPLILDSEAPRGALKRHLDDLRQLPATVKALKSDQDALKRDQDALKRNQDALKRDQDALKRDQGALKRDQDAMKQRDQYDMRRLSITVDDLKRDHDNLRQLSTTVDALKRELDNERSRIATLEQASCPKGYTMWRGICYKAFNKMKAFNEAAAACRADGGTLAMPRDAETDAFLISLYKFVSEHSNFWIGLHDRRKWTRFEWVDGSALGPYSSWAPGQPRPGWGAAREACVSYSSRPSQKDKWDNENCHMRTSIGDRRDSHHYCTTALRPFAVKVTRKT